MADIFSNSIFIYGVIPLLIILSRIIDVSLGTVRLILTNKGVKLLSSIIGFFEVLIWVLVITTVMKNLTNILAYIAYALGFSLGTYFGIYLEEKISIGQVRLNIITTKDLEKMIDDLKPTQYVFVTDSVNSSQGPIKIINAFLERKYLKAVIKKVKERDPDAFYTVEDLKMIKEDSSVKLNFFGLRKIK